MIGDEIREGLFLDAGWCGDEMFSSPSWFLKDHRGRRDGMRHDGFMDED